MSMMTRHDTGNPGHPLRVLVVDDEEPVRRYVERVLAGAGHDVITAADASQAMQVSVDAYDVLVTDLMMPEITGDELARRLRQTRPTLKVLYLTGFSDRLFREKMVLWEGEAFLDKPCSVRGLQEAVSLLCYGTIAHPAP